MKNRLSILLILFFFLSEVSFAEPFIFKTQEIEIKDNGNEIYAKDGKAFSSDNNLEIEASNFEYFKNSDLLKAYNGIAFIKSDNLKIIFNEIQFDQKKFEFKAKNNVKIFDIKNKFTIETELVDYNWKKRILDSKTNSVLKDQFNNVFNTQVFNYDLNKNILKIKNANFKDFERNNFYVELAYINTLSNKLFGKDISIDLNNKSFNKDNEPRLKGKSVTYENYSTEISKGVFTTCKKTDKCPPWQLSAEKIQHDKKKKIINYKNAWLKVYDVPVFYFPKFFHPDPTVDRKSGFLIPSLNSSTNSKSYLSVPYFYAMSSNKDMTFTPRFYAEDKLLLQTEYRKVAQNSNHFSDFSLFNEKDKNSKSHFFYKYNKTMNFNYFENSDIKFNIEKTSNDTYLKTSKLISPLIEDYDVLENSVALSLNSDEMSINTDFIVYEDLNKKNNSDKYEFILPRLSLTKDIENNTNLNGNFSFRSNNIIRNYQTNVLEKTNINDLIFNSSPRITSNGFYNNYDFILKNVNSDTQTSKDFKEDENFYLSGLFQYNSSLPLIKDNNNFQNILKPKLALKISPNNTKDMRTKETKIDVTNIYNLERLSRNDTIEGGISLSYGNDFTIFDKKNSRDYFSLEIANNLRFEENDDLSQSNQLGAKTSNLFGEITYNPNDFINMKYSNSTKNNIKDTVYENFIAELSLNNFVTSFDYLNENNTLNKNSYLLNTTKYALNNYNNIVFSTRENKTKDLTEYYNLMYQYKNDCLAASIEYNKNYYDDRDIKPEENIFLKLTIIPFGQANTPNLKN